MNDRKSKNCLRPLVIIGQNGNQRGSSKTIWLKSLGQVGSTACMDWLAACDPCVCDLLHMYLYKPQMRCSHNCIILFADAALDIFLFSKRNDPPARNLCFCSIYKRVSRNSVQISMRYVTAFMHFRGAHKAARNNLVFNSP